jgi:hypothetical protein
LSKIIENRLKNILSKVIYENQGGFMQRIQIVDNIIMVQEYIHSTRENKDKGMIIKINMANSFDKAINSFLLMFCLNLVFVLIPLYNGFHYALSLLGYLPWSMRDPHLSLEETMG